MFDSNHIARCVAASLLVAAYLLQIVGCGDDSNGTLSGPSLSICKGKVDSDHDGVCDALENQIGTDPSNPNTDAPLDPFPDGSDFNPTGKSGAPDSNSNNGWITLSALIALPMITGAIEAVVKKPSTPSSSSSGGGSNGGTTTPPPAPISDEDLHNQLSTGNYLNDIIPDLDKSFMVLFPRSTTDNTGTNWVMAVFVEAKYKNLPYRAAAILYLKLENSEAWSTVLPVTGLPVFPTNPQLQQGFEGDYVRGDGMTFNEPDKALEAVRTNNHSDIQKYSGFFMWRSDNNQYTSLDPFAVGYKLINADTHLYGAVNASNPSVTIVGTMQFFAAIQPTTSVANLPNSTNNTGYPGTVSIPLSDLNHPCLMGLANGNVLNRCAMTTFTDPASPRLWKRTSPNDFLGTTHPWDGIWKKYNYLP
jgi:hypothetical protein